jgi:ribonuclease BN (tRNA processing enzyme)
VQRRAVGLRQLCGTSNGTDDTSSSQTRIPLRPQCYPSFNPGPHFDGFELTFLGTSSKGCARRFPSSLALRLRSRTGSQVWLFDAGEGALAQMQRSHLKASQLRHIFITHMHADHVYGLPGIILAALHLRGRSPNGALDHTEGSSAPQDAPLTVYGPPGLRCFLRATLGTTLPNLREGLLRIVELALPEETQPQKRYKRQSAYWNAPLRQLPFEAPDVKAVNAVCNDMLVDGSKAYTYNILDCTSENKSMVPFALEDEINGFGALAEGSKISVEDSSAPASVQAALVNHSVPSVAYVITEDVRTVRFDKEKLLAHGFAIDGRSEYLEYFQSLLRGESVWFKGRLVRPEDVVRKRRPRRICIVGDTCDASGVAHLAMDVDVLVHEATVCAADTHIARKRGHSSSRTAAEFAKRVGARRLVLNHTSVGYSPHQVRRLEAEARTLLGFDRAYVAYDMSVFNVPRPSTEVDDNFSFRTFLGHPRWESSVAVNEMETLPGSDGCESRSLQDRKPATASRESGDVDGTESTGSTAWEDDQAMLIDDEDTTQWSHSPKPCAVVASADDVSAFGEQQPAMWHGADMLSDGLPLESRRNLFVRGSVVI